MIWLRRILLAVLALLVALAATLYARHGGGEDYPDLNTAPLLPDSALEVAAQYPEPIGNVAASADGRLFFTVHPESRPERIKLLEWRDGRAVPYPSEADQTRWQTPLGLTIDRQQRLWVIDHGEHGVRQPRLVALSLADGKTVFDLPMPASAAPLGSFLQDLRVSPDGATVVIADVSFWRKQPALVVVDVAAKTARRLLQGHESVMPQDWLVRTPAKAMRFFGGLVNLKPGVDGVAISDDGQWVSYAAMAHASLYRVPMATLTYASLTSEQVATRVERLGSKPLSDGISMDSAGNVLLTDVEHGSVMRWRADSRRLETLVRSDRIRWSDALSHGADGWLYVADSAIPEQMLRSKAHIASQAPYTVWRFKTDVPAAPGQ